MKRCKLIGMIFAMLCLTACGKDRLSSERVSLADNMIHLYVVEENTIECAPDDYQLKTPDVVTTCVEDIMTAMTALDTSKLDSYTYMFGEDNSLQMTITMRDGTYEQEDILLEMAAVTKTLFQLNDIASISLSVQDAAANVMKQELFTRDTIYYYDCDEPSLMEHDITMYVPNEQETALQSYGIKVQAEPQTSDQELIIRELVQKNVLPKDTKVNQVSVHGTVCYLDLSTEIASGVGTLSPELTIYAVVNSVIAQTGVESVQILIDGKIIPTYRNTVALDKPLSFQSDVVETK